MGRARGAGAAAAIGLLTLLAAMPAAFAGGKASDMVAAEPVPGSQVAPKGSYFLLHAHAGDVVTQQVRLTNANGHAVTARVDPVDAFTNDATGTAFGNVGSGSATTSRWITVDTPELTLQANEQRNVSFTVRVPSSVTPGQYLAGVSAWVPLTGAATAPDAGANRAAFELNIQYQRVVAVEVDIPGPAAPQLVVTGAEPAASPRGIDLDVHIANRGNAFAHGSGVIRIADTQTDYTFTINTFVSRTAIVYHMPWTKQVAPGSHHVEVDLTYEGGRRATWTGTVAITGALQNQLEGALRNVTVGARRHGGINVLVVIGAVAAALLVLGAIALRRRTVEPVALPGAVVANAGAAREDARERVKSPVG